MTQRSAWTWCVILMLSGMLCGCESGNPLGRLAVSGKVTLGSQPLEQGNISFEPLDQHGVGSGALIHGGRYDIPKQKGLPPGQYRVRIYASIPRPPGGNGPDGEPPAPGADLPGQELIPPQFNMHSELTREVSKDRDNQFNFDVPSA
jgi:hypothetical protein